MYPWSIEASLKNLSNQDFPSTSVSSLIDSDPSEGVSNKVARPDSNSIWDLDGTSLVHAKPCSGKATDERLTGEAKRLLLRIQSKANELASSSIDDRDVFKLKARAAFYWEDRLECSSLPLESAERDKPSSVTKWRSMMARKAYTAVQQLNPDLLIPFLLVAPPTKCSGPAFKLALPMIQQHPELLQYRILLDSKLLDVLRSFMADTTSPNPGVSEFVESILPRTADFVNPERFVSDEYWPRSIDFPVTPVLLQSQSESHETSCNSSSVDSLATHGDQSYSSVPMEQIGQVVDSLMQGLYESEIAVREILDGAASSQRVTITVPLDTKDCVCRLLISRETAVEVIRKWQMKRVIS